MDKWKKQKMDFIEENNDISANVADAITLDSKNGYPDHIKLKAIKYYLEGNEFRRIERLMGVSHVSVINWVKQLASTIQQIPKKNEKVDRRLRAR